MDSKVYNLKFVNSTPLQFNENILYVQKFAEDTVGTTFGASWVYVFNEKHDRKIALYKPLDYDEPLGAYAELLYSHITKLCYSNLKLRVPDIHLASENSTLGLLSYSIVDRITEDLIHIESLIPYKYTTETLKKFFTLGINDILECIEHEIHNKENFAEVKKAVIFTVLLDAFTNNVDRHGKNWGLIRDKHSDYYELAIFDNVKSFINMFFNRAGYKNSTLWAIQYNGTASSSKLETGNQIAEFIKKTYPEYFEEFISILKNTRETFISDISSIQAIDSTRISSHLKKKIKYFGTLNQNEV